MILFDSSSVVFTYLLPPMALQIHCKVIFNIKNDGDLFITSLFVAHKTKCQSPQFSNLAYAK